jgi:type IV pilus assembly protein PilO
MTYADEAEFMPPEGQEESPNYPSAFGITFTPKVGGIIFGVIGLGLATYLLVNVVQPAWENYQKVEDSVNSKKNQVQQQQAIQRQIKAKTAELAQVKQQNQQVLNLFASEKTLDTLLLDLNSFVKSRNGRLTSFKPELKPAAKNPNDPAAATTLANGKLQRKVYNVKLEGSFDQTQSILRSFERLQSLVIVRDLKATVVDAQGLLIDPQSGRSVPAVFRKDQNNKAVPGGKPTIETTFNLETLLPATDQQAQEAAAQPAQKPKK